MAEVKLINVSKIYEGKAIAVQDVNISVNDKEFLVLVGPSGCGKSTTLRMVAGLEEVTSGEIYIDNKLVNDVSPKDRDIAMVFQNYALYPHMTVFDNMSFGLRLRKFKKADIKKRVMEAAQILELESYLNRKPKALSGGQEQRVAMGRAQMRTPMVFQNYALYPHMTVFDNMSFGLRLRKFEKADIKKRVMEAAQILELESYLNRKPKALSGGQRQRVALGRAIVRHPKVFLFDEPLSNLDAKLRVQMRTEISKLHKQLEATIIYVTHDQTEAMTMGDRIALMKDGIVQQIDTPLNLYNRPKNKFAAGFIGSPPMNFIDGLILNDNSLLFKSKDDVLTIRLPHSYQNSLKNYINS